MRWPHAVLLASVCAVAAGSAQAAPIVGTVNLSGDISIAIQAVDYLPVGGPSGTFRVNPTNQTGSFAPLASTSGTILDLGAGQPSPVLSFMTFSANPAIRIDLLSLVPSTFSTVALGQAPAAGQTASPAVGSPFSLINLTASSSTLSFAGTVRAVNTTTGEITTGNVLFSMLFADKPLQTIGATLVTGGSVGGSYSASLAVVPEPGVLALLAIGALPMLRRRRSPGC